MNYAIHIVLIRKHVNTNNLHVQRRSFDLITFLLILFLCACGLLFVFSATYSQQKPFSSFFIKQTIGVCSGVIIYFLCLLPDYRTLMRWGYVSYFGVIALLIFTLINGSIGMGGKRWINLFFFKIQPSDLAKILFPIYMVNYLHMKKKTVIHSFGFFIPILSMLGLSFILIQKQPDLGTAIIILFSGLLLCWLADLNKKFFLYSMLFLLLIAPILWTVVLRDYQKKRITVFFGHGNQKKEGYQIEQARIAIGSGSLWGKGLFNGTQNRLRFLPESRTDFICTIILVNKNTKRSLCSTIGKWSFNSHIISHYNQHWHGARNCTTCRHSSTTYELWLEQLVDYYGIFWDCTKYYDTL